MRCPQCQTENRDGRRFCRECGASLAGICGSCGFANEADDKFCGGCGEKLGKEPPPAKPSPKPAAPPRDGAERRHLTVMFCDLAGSTAMSEQLDPEDLREINLAYQDAGTRSIERFDGYVARYMGDGILAYFGYPTAHEDDAERAVRAGLALVDAVGELGRTLGARVGVEMRVRVGIATGLVVVGDLVGQDAAQERAVVGETPNLAARLQGLAEPDTVAVAGSTRRLLGDRFELRDLGTHRLKGFTDPLPVWQVTGESEAVERLEAPGAAPLVGRKAELDLLADRWSRASRGDGQIVGISGEAGIGKSRLIYGLRERMIEGPHAWLHYRCSPFHTSSALHPVLEELSIRAGFEAGDDPARKLGRLAELLRPSGVDPKQAVPLLASMLSITLAGELAETELEGEARKDRTLDVLLRDVDAMASTRPVLVTVEDLHWVDPTTLELLERLVARVPDRPILLVASFRPSFEATWGGRRNVTLLNVGKLGRDEVTAMTTGVTGGKALPPEVLAEIVRRTDGIPLFVEELTKTIVASAELADRGDRFELVGTLEGLAIPATLQDSLTARLDQLGPVKSLAQVGAAIGREFGRRLLLEVASETPAAVDAGLERLVDAQIVTRRIDGDDDVFTFRHALTQNAAYEGLLRSRRKALHGRIATALRASTPDLIEREPERIAHHYAQGGEPALAVEFWERAGQHAAERSAHEEAVRHLRDALRCLAQVPESAERVDRELSLLLSLVASCRMVDRHAEALESLERAQQLATDHRRTTTASEIHHFRGNIYFVRGNIDGCLAEHGLALSTAREAGSAEHEARALGGLGDAYYSRGHMITANEHFTRCVELARAHGFRRTEAANRHMIGWTDLFLLRFEEAVGHGMEAARQAVELGHRRAEMVARAVVAYAWTEMGEPDRGRPYADASLELARRLGTASFEAAATYYRARMSLFAGDFEVAKDVAEEALALAEERGVMAFVGPALLGLLAGAARDDGQRRRALERGIVLLDAGAVGHNRLWFASDGIEACIAAGDWDWAERLADRLEADAAEQPLPATTFHVERARAIVTAGRRGLDAETRTELERLREQATRVRLTTALPAIERVLGT